MTTTSNFWANKGAAAKRKYRFKLRVRGPGAAGSPGGKFEEWVVTKVSRPSFSITDTQHSYLNHTFKFPGRITWEDVSFSIVEPYAGDQTDVLMTALAQSGYAFPVLGNYETIAKQKAIFSQFEIEAIDDKGAPADIWYLENAWISNASLGEYDYSSDDLMGIDITVKYDYARYESKDAGAANSLESVGKPSGA